MSPFLLQIAQTFYKEYGSGISDRIFVFPNRRAGLFFRKYISEAAQRPLLSPTIHTINEIIELCADMRPADPVELVIQLYDVYTHHVPTAESLDSFWFWGEMLLTDFDDMDKYKADAALVFRNLHDLKQLDTDYDFLSERQKRAILSFWETFNGQKDTTYQRQFDSLYQYLPAIYQTFTQQLSEQKKGYAGLLQREAIRRLQNGAVPQTLRNKEIVFIGFNALTPCERQLLEWFKQNGQGDYYWDYDGTALHDPENIASRFATSNQKEFPSRLQLPAPDTHWPQIHMVAIPSAVGQAKYACHCLNTLCPEGSDYTDTAIVLPDENMLLPVLQSLPPHITHVNVTMGYPLMATPIMGFIDHLAALRLKMQHTKEGVRYYHKTVTSLLTHKYVHEICPRLCDALTEQIIRNNSIYIPAEQLAELKNRLLSVLFDAEIQSEWSYVYHVLRELMVYFADTEHSLDAAYIARYYSLCSRFMDVLNTPFAPILQPDTIYRLLRQCAAKTTLPFVGEPLTGLQIMGMLETRSLDFKNLIIISANEGTLPKRQTSNSFIPYNLRVGFGLPTYEHQDAVTAYHFYRLISRSQCVYMLYDNRAEEQQNEVSRYVLQMEHQYHLPLLHENVSEPVSLTVQSPIAIQKTDEVRELLAAYCQPDGRALSASAINTYIDCPLKFYLMYLKNIQSPDEVSENIESDMFGTIYHAAMERLYRPYEGQTLSRSDIKGLRNNSILVERLLVTIYSEVYLHLPEGKLQQPEGNHLLVIKTIQEFVSQQLLVDAAHAPFRYIASEQNYQAQYEIDGVGKVNLTGFVDRIDEKDGTIRIVDYKTGKAEGLYFDSLEDVFLPAAKRPRYALQTLLYAWLYLRNTEAKQAIIPGIMALRNLFAENPFLSLEHKEEGKRSQLTDYRHIDQTFGQRLSTCLTELFDPTIPFTQTNQNEQCTHCPFASICQKG